MSACCGMQDSKVQKFGEDECFSCLGNSVALLFEPGVIYPCCSPLVQGETKHSPLKRMESKDDCIVAWVGPYCAIDASDWEEACKQHVYPCAKVYKSRANWPEAEDGTCIFTVEDIEHIAQAHPGCCVGFDELADPCPEAPDYVKEIDVHNHSGKSA